jgi:glutathione S-transferase
MANYKLTYFDLNTSRGEECRLALHVAGVEFEDYRISRPDWQMLKPKTPYGALPILDTPGKGTLAQTNAILAYIGRAHDLHPKDLWEAARHEAIMHSVEDVRAALATSGKPTDPAEKKAAREALATGYLQTWGASINSQITGPFLAGTQINVADIKLFQIVSSLKAGVMDHIPATVFSAFPKLEAQHAAVARHPKILEWQAKHSNKG